jgi:polysaccharide transporter, PST family
MNDTPGASGAQSAPAPQRTAFISSGWLLMENAVRLCITAVVSFWAARQLGPGDFGLLNFASALTAILYAAATLGLEVPVVLRLARGDAAGTVLGTVLRLRFVASLGAVLMAGTAAWALRDGDTRAQAVMLIVALSIIGSVPMVLDCVFKARVDAGPPARARLATTLLSAGAKAAVLLADAGVVALACTVVFEAVVGSLLMGWAWWRHRAGHLQPSAPAGPHSVGSNGDRSNSAGGHLHHDPALARALLRQSLPLVGAAAAIALQLKADVVLLGYLASDLEAGQYALAQKLSEVLYVVPVVLVDSVYPLLARQRGAVKAAPHDLNDQLMFDLAAAAGMVCSGACLLLARPLIWGVFGAAYEATVPLWQWHGLTCLAVALDVARQRWLVTRGLQKKALNSALLGAGLVIGLNLLLIPIYGATAAAGVAVLAWFGAGVLATLAWRHDDSTRALAGLQWRALWPWQRLWRVLRPLHALPGLRP